MYSSRRLNDTAFVSEILVESMSPHGGGVAAYVEDDGQSVHLYLHGLPGECGPVRSVWVANRVAAPEALNEETWPRGTPPRQPRAHCDHRAGTKALDVESLSLVWLPEGDGVALYEGDVLSAAIPGWSGENGFHGYARRAVGEGPFAWELTRDNVMHARFAAARRFWAAWERPETWASLRASQVARLGRQLGGAVKTKDAAGEVWPPLELASVSRADATVLVTVGMAVRPMPQVERAVEDPAPWRRIELGAVLPPGISQAQGGAVARALVGFARLPWAHVTWLGHGHSVESDALRGAGYGAFLLHAARASAVPVELADVDGDPVTLLWLVPVTDVELARAKREGSDAVLEGMRLPRPIRG